MHQRTIHDEIADRGHDEDFEPPLAAEPTLHAPGSWGKIQAMVGRIARGEAIFHPLDFTERNCTVEEANEALPLIQAAVAGNRKSVEFLRRQEKILSGKRARVRK